MSRLSSIKSLALALLAMPTLLLAQPRKASHVILITIDGMRGEMINDPTLATENLKQMKAEGLYVDWIKGVTPSATYPSHTTIVTGALPSDHHIYYNAPFMGNAPRTISYWYADSIKAETIWQAVSDRGGTVASLFWPVSTRSRHIKYNVPEYWSIKPGADQMAFLRDNCSPRGLLDTLELHATGRLDYDENFTAGSINRDAKEAFMANYIMNHYHPALLTLHLITTDYAQHQTGLNSPRTRRTIESADAAVGIILDNLRDRSMLDSTLVIVTGDHGFVDVDRQLAPNTMLVKAGLLGKDYGTDWKACFHGAGAMSFLYLKKADDNKTLRKVERLLADLPDSVRREFRVIRHDELTSLGCDPKVALAIEPVAGVDMSNSREGGFVQPRLGGTHGYSCGADHTALVAYGAGIGHATVPTMNQTSIKQFILDRLALPVPANEEKRK